MPIPAKALLASALATLTFSCNSPQARYDKGYQDGYAAGFATECGPRAMLIDGDFTTEPYRRGLTDGYRDGVKACPRER